MSDLLKSEINILSKLDISDIDKILELFSNILLELYNYLLNNKLNILTNTDIYRKCKGKIITDIIEIIADYFDLSLIEEILRLYNEKISSKIRYQNIALNNYFYNLLVKSIIYYYEYYYYIHLIIKDISITHETIGAIIVSHYNTIFTDAPIDISQITYNTESKSSLICRILKIKSKQINYCIESTLLYKYILYNFYKFITTMTELETIDEYIIGEYIGRYIINENISMNEIESKIIKFLNDINKIYISTFNKNSYITLPQYQDICWFIAFITSITFSDKSNLLLSNKTFSYKPKYNFSLREENYFNDDPSETLQTLIYYIKNKVYKQSYINLGNDECKILLILKHLPIRFIIQLYNKMYNSIIENKDEIERESIIYNEISMGINYSSLHNDNFNYFNNIYLQHHNQIQDENYKSTINFAIDIEDCIIYKEIYKLLDINALYLYKKKANYIYIKSINKENELSIIPDVILIQILSYTTSPLDKYISIIPSIDNIGNLTIEYKDNIYELDYIIFLTNPDHTNKNISHAICCINYNNEEYYYDQRYVLDNKKCFDDISTDTDVYLTCPLIKQRWTDKLEQNKYFCLNKCHQRDINPFDDIHLMTKDNTSEELCYSYNSDYIYGYVKTNRIISTSTIKITGGYKSINKKIKLFINNNYIERTIYVNKNGLKYIRIDNKYILLKNK